MEVEYDPNKDRENKREHGYSLAFASELDWDLAFCWLDLRFHSDELRMNGLVPKGGSLYCF
ncbi:BrnT family toxin [Massilia sp. SR12]